jgi:methionyl-tRNA formyltransferase
MGEKGLAVLKAIRDNVALVVYDTDPGQENFTNSILRICDSKHLNRRSWHDIVRNDTDGRWAIAVGWRRIIKAHQGKLIVFHDSLLPKYRGFAPLVNALLSREKYVGVTAILAKDDYDTGDIIDQLKMEVDYPTTIAAEITRISALYGVLATKILADLNAYNPRQQNEGDATYSMWRDEEDYVIDWDQNAEIIKHFISCVGPPYRGAKTMFIDREVRVFDAEVVEDVKIVARSKHIGKVIFKRDKGPVVVCRTGLLMLTETTGLEDSTKFRIRFT